MIRGQKSVAEAAAHFGVGAWTLRRLEASGRIPHARRDPLTGFRVYDDAALQEIQEALDILAAHVSERELVTPSALRSA